MRVAFDHQIFCLQNYGGISRYFVRMAENMLESGNDLVCFARLHRNNYLKDLPQSAVSGRWVERYWPRTTRAILAYNYFLSRQDMRKWQPDVVHETYYSRFGSGSKGCPRVLTVYDMIHELFPESFSDRDNTTQLKRMAVERADHVICISESTRRDLLKFFSVPEHKVSVVHLGFEHFTAPSLGPSLSRPYLLYVGSRHGYKNFSGLLRAVASSARLKRDFDIVAFGGGGFSDAEQQSIRNLGYGAGQVRQVSGDDVVLGGLYDAARAFVYPSLYEGFGLPPLEAMRHSCPVISSGTSSMPEVIGDAGVFFDPSDSDEMAGAIERVVYSESEIADLVGRGHERLNHFSWQRCTQETLSIYQGLQR
ncbi:glycosyltransferase family 4 protein [Pseudomonas fuscovaginae UPB0736]|uniref:glycosyltransferase family 4 protein n=1 Tax=Pseudomonas asplenii TaxID=53407 RepID=UPI0002882191|nr:MULTISPECIES: glycosyltransferase family 1 protein [Pseudomonas]UUQ66758.1 glycosyltransferase family 4 protein [Pseudomonas fuscovaginae UPB0736]UZE29961.1 glycosyltransferase family 4 protein [Pseudomonas asplenii]